MPLTTFWWLAAAVAVTILQASSRVVVELVVF
jgi:hypothetical protein